MKFLRTASTRRLVATIAGLVAAIAAGTAIAVAAAGNGPVAPAKRLANAIHDALRAPAISGITATVTFTNRLIDSSNIHGADPILTGASGRLWLSSDHGLRLELQSNGSGYDAQAVLQNGSFWVYDPSSNTVFKGKLPVGVADKPGAAADKPGAAGKKRAASYGSNNSPAGQGRAPQDTIPSIATIQSDLTKLIQHVDVSGAIAGDIGGEAAYTVSISPKHDGGLLGSAELGWDAKRGVPLRIAVYARGDTLPVLELVVTSISFGPVLASDVTFTPPIGATVVNVSVPAPSAAARKADALASRKGKRRGHKPAAEMTGVAAVAAKVHFKLVAPSRLVGLPRRTVRLLDWGGSPAALVAYGQNLGGIAVIEQPAASAKTSTAATTGDKHRGLSLPTVSIKGVAGQELDTALGTVVRFTRGGVAYTVLGSVPAWAAEAAARRL